MRFFRSLGRSLGSLFGSAPRPVRQETLTLPDLIGWFVDNKEAKTDGVVAFSYIEAAGRPARLKGLPDADGTAEPVVVQGFFNQKTGEVLRSRTIRAGRIDDEVLEAHAGKDMVVYQ